LTSTAQKICSLCCKNAQETKLKKCSGCLEVRYCSKECQTTAWYKGHKVSCKDFSGLKKMVTSAKIVKLGGGAFAVEHCPEISPELLNCLLLKKDLFETLDNAKQYAEIQRIVSEDVKLKVLFKYHARVTSPMYTWNFMMDMPNLLD